eukprot:8938437-Heterocapsa_arctica.AAC.1
MAGDFNTSLPSDTAEVTGTHIFPRRTIAKPRERISMLVEWLASMEMRALNTFEEGCMRGKEECWTWKGKAAGGRR